MTILRYTASLDNTITNAFDSSLLNRATASNMGAADILEVFSIYGNATTASVELSRILIQFPIDKIIEDRNNDIIPASGSVKFMLKLYNAPHFQATPRNFDLLISAVSSSWQEGDGMDMDNYLDTVPSGGIGSNWLTSSKGNQWAKAGGDYHNLPTSSYTFTTGLEDLNVDVSNTVEHWIKGAGGDHDNGRNNYGFGIRLTNEYEGYFSGSTDAEMSGNINIHNITGSTESYYTKKFFGRGTEFFFKRPVIEAQFDNRIKDDRSNFYLSSSLLASVENENNIYFYNYFRGQLRDIGGKTTNVPSVQFFRSSGSVPEGDALSFKNTSNAEITSLNATRVSKGVYKAIVVAPASMIESGDPNYPYVHDVWSYDGAQVFTGSAITPIKYRPSSNKDIVNYVLSMPNLKKEYAKRDNVRLRLYAREKNWSPNIYTVAKSKPQNLTLVSASFSVIRIVDNLEVVKHGYGDIRYSLLSYDEDGNYFDFNMKLLEPGYQYGFKFSVYDDYASSFEEQPYVFKFRVKE